MHNFELHSNESVCRKGGRLGLDQVYKQTKIVIKYPPKMTLPHAWMSFLTRRLFLNVFPVMLGVKWCYHVANLVDYKNFNSYVTLDVSSFWVHRHLCCWIWGLFGPQCHDWTPMVSYINMTVLVWSNPLFGCQVLSRWF